MKIGFIGLGNMGEGMSANIIKKHDDKVFVFDLLEEKVKMIAEKGAVPCKNAAEVAENAEIIITMLPRSEHVKSIYDEILPVVGTGKICVDMSTIDPSVSMEIAEEVKKTGAKFADCPVLKSKYMAAAGKLGIYAGCDEETYEILEPILYYMGENVMRIGENGAGITMKICQNALTHEIQNAVNETLTLANICGIPTELFVKAISIGGAQNYYLESKADALINDDFTCQFPVIYAEKDLSICKRLSESHNFPMPGIDVSLAALNKTMEMGFGMEDNCACIKAVRDGFI